MASILRARLKTGKKITTRIKIDDKPFNYTVSVVYDDTNTKTRKESERLALREAEDVEVARRAELYRKQTGGLTLADMKVRVMQETFNRSRNVNKAERTRSVDEWFNALWRSPFFSPDMHVADLTSEALSQYAVWAYEDDHTVGRKGLRNKTITRHLNFALKQGVRLLIADGKMHANDVVALTQLRWPKLQLERKSEQHPGLTGKFRKPELLLAVCDKLRHADHIDTLLFTLGTGLRHEELERVTRDMVVTPGLEHSFSVPTLRLRGKQFGYAARDIPLTTMAWEAWERLVNRREGQAQLFKPKATAQAFKRAGERLTTPLADPLTLRDLRHCYGTWLANEAKASLTQIAALMGNSEASCVKYLHSTVEWSEAVTAKLKMGFM